MCVCACARATKNRVLTFSDAAPIHESTGHHTPYTIRTGKHSDTTDKGVAEVEGGGRRGKEEVAHDDTV